MNTLAGQAFILSYKPLVNACERGGETPRNRPIYTSALTRTHPFLRLGVEDQRGEEDDMGSRRLSRDMIQVRRGVWTIQGIPLLFS